MSYRIRGLQSQPFAPLFGMHDSQLAEHGAQRVVAQDDKGWQCRVSLEDAKAGDSLILINHVSHDVPTPYKFSYAIYVSEKAGEAADYVGSTPPVFEGRPIALRAFDAKGMLRNASLALPGQADEKILELLVADEIAYIHAHNVAHGCFAAKVERA